MSEKRRISPQEIRKWLDADTSAYGKKMTEAVGESGMRKIARLMDAASEKTIFDWRTETAFIRIDRP